MKQALKVFLFIIKVTFTAFGGGNAVMPTIKKEAVDKRQWLTEEEFDNVLITTNAIPGPSVVETLSFISIKVLGKLWGSVVALIAILPHILFACGLYVIASKYLPEKYLFILNISILPAIVGVLLAFSYRYLKTSYKELGWIRPTWIAIATIAFSLFVPSPYNISALCLIVVLIVKFLHGYIKHKKENK